MQCMSSSWRYRAADADFSGWSEGFGFGLVAGFWRAATALSAFGFKAFGYTMNRAAVASQDAYGV